jgi:KDO2-lipid IV(A) lauroyltransferase
VETGKGLLEAGPLWLWPRERVLGLVREVVGEPALEAAFATGRGVVLLAPHLGCWELAGLYCSARYPLTSLYQPFRLEGLDRLMRAARARAGARLVPATGAGVRALRRALARGEAIGILPDQDPAVGSGVFAPFFGVPAHTMTLALRLIQHSAAPAVFVFAERLGSGVGFRLHFVAADPGLADPPIDVAAASLNQGVERCIRQAPAQYLWVYKRFKTRPPGEAKVYPLPVPLAWVRRMRRRWRKRWARRPGNAH